MNIWYFTFGISFLSILRKSYADTIQSEFAKVIRCNDKTGLKVGVKQKVLHDLQFLQFSA